MDSLVAEARLLAEKGVKELVVIAQDITRYGQDLPGHPHLAVSYTHLNPVSEEPPGPIDGQSDPNASPAGSMDPAASPVGSMDPSACLLYTSRCV